MFPNKATKGLLQLRQTLFPWAPNAQKNRPRYSRDGATRAEVKLSQESGGGFLEPVALFLSAVCADLNRYAEVQTEHSHKAFGVDSGAVVAHHNAEGLHRGQLHETLYILEGVQYDIKMLHGICPPMLYKSETFVYNEQTQETISV